MSQPVSCGGRGHGDLSSCLCLCQRVTDRQGRRVGFIIIAELSPAWPPNASITITITITITLVIA